MAEAIVNHRIHPMQTVKEVIDFDKQLINDDSVEIEIVGDAIEPHPISPYEAESFGYQTIQKSIRQVFTDTIAVSGCFLASTDTRWYLPFTKSVYRFSPSIMQGMFTLRFLKQNNHFSYFLKVKKTHQDFMAIMNVSQWTTFSKRLIFTTT